MKKNLVAIFILGLILVAGFVLAIGGLPYTFIGEAQYNNENLEGYQVVASVGGQSLGLVGLIGPNNTLVKQNGVDGIDLYSRDGIGTISGKVIFYVGGVETEPNKELIISGNEESRTIDDIILTLPEAPEGYVSCGDGNVSEGEQCDGTEFEYTGATCANIMSLIYNQEGYSGPLSCTSICTYDVTNCTAPQDPNSGGGSSGGSSGGSGGSGGGGGGGSSSSSSGSPSSSSNLVTLSTNTTAENENTNSTENSTSEDANIKKGFTGLAVSDFVKTTGGKISIVVLGLIILGLIFVSVKKKSNKKLKK